MMYISWMKNTFLYLGLILLLPACEVPFESPHALPLVKIHVDEQVRPEPKVPAVLTIELDGKEVFHHDIGIEYRGSTSYRVSDKKSFGFETLGPTGEAKDVHILGMPAESDWILMGDVYRNTSPTEFISFDPSLLHHYIGYELAREMGMYAARSKWVEVELNGEYLGLYQMMEKIKASTWRVDISEADADEGSGLTGGYMLKIDKSAGSETGGTQPLSYYDSNWGDDAKYTASIAFRSNYDVFGDTLDIPAFQPPYHPEQYLETYFLYEHPSANELTYAKRTYLKTSIEAFESALLNNQTDLSEHIDLKSFAQYFILNELAGNIDAYRLSTFMYKPRNGPWHLGPVWDLNIGYGRQNRVPTNDWIARYNDYVSEDAWMVPFWWEYLLENDAFRNEVKQLWGQYRKNALSNTAVVQKVRNTEEYLTSTGGYARNYQRWRPEQGSVDVSAAVNFLVDYLEQRLAWMDQELSNW